MNKRRIYIISGVLIVLLIWQILYWTVNVEMLLASPFQVVKRLFQLCKESDFYLRLGMSSIRIFGGFLISFILGIALAILAGRFSPFEYIFKPFTVIIKSVPVASFIVLFLIWFDTNITMIICFLIAFPVVYTNSLNGYKSADEKLLEMAQIYKVSYFKKLFYIIIPSMKSYIISASTVSIGMAWKAGVAAEVIGVSELTVGEKLNEAKIYCNNADLLAWTFVIVIASIVLEKVFTLLLNMLFRRFR